MLLVLLLLPWPLALEGVVRIAASATTALTSGRLAGGRVVSPVTIKVGDPGCQRMACWHGQAHQRLAVMAGACGRRHLSHDALNNTVKVDLEIGGAHHICQ